MNFAVAQKPYIAPKLEAKIREPFVMPEAGEKELFYEYVTTVKRDSPIQYKACAGIVFQKKTLDPSWSYRDSENVIPDQYIPTILLTEEQAKAVQKRLDETPVKIPQTVDKDGKITPGYMDAMANHLILKKTAEYTIDRVVPQKVGLPDFRDSLMKEQAKDIPNKKK